MGNKVEAISGCEILAEREAGLIFDTITKLKAVKAENALKGVPGCKYLLDKRITDLQRCKDGLEKGPSMATLACLHQKMRQDRLTHINERDIARSKWKIEKRKKDMNKMIKAKWKKRLRNRKMELKAAKLYLLKEGTCFTTGELGDSPIKSKHHWSPKSCKARMDCLDRVRLMSPELPLMYQGQIWTL